MNRYEPISDDCAEAEAEIQRLSCEDCTAQIKLVNSAFSEPSDIRHITHEDEARYWLSDEAMEND